MSQLRYSGGDYMLTHKARPIETGINRTSPMPAAKPPIKNASFNAPHFQSVEAARTYLEARRLPLWLQGAP